MCVCVCVVEGGIINFFVTCRGGGMVWGWNNPGETGREEGEEGRKKFELMWKCGLRPSNKEWN